MLMKQGYEYLQIHIEENMIVNICETLGELNDYKLKKTCLILFGNSDIYRR